jgi:hypothetical protein
MQQAPSPQPQAAAPRRRRRWVIRWQRRRSPSPIDRSTPPAGSCPTDPTHLTNRQTCQADRIPAAVPGADRPKEVPVQANDAYGTEAASRSHGTGGLVLR